MSEPPAPDEGTPPPDGPNAKRLVAIAVAVALGLLGAVALGSVVAPTTDVILLVVGFVLLLGGAEFLVRGAATLAERLGVGPLAIGLTVVAFGTSAPELVIGLAAVIKNKPDFNVGNVVGSNIANVGLIYGTTAAVSAFACSRVAIRREIPIMIVATLLAILAMLDGTIHRWEGLSGLALLALYLSRSFVVARREYRVESEEAAPGVPLPNDTALALITALTMVATGLLALVGGGHLLIESGTGIARSFGVPEIVIGLTVVAIGTSLPELATCVVAALRNQPEIVVGNVVGSNLFNLLFVLGITSTVTPIPVSPLALSLDVWIMLAFAVAMPLVSLTGGRVTRPEGLLLLAGYVAYAVVRYTL